MAVGGKPLRQLSGQCRLTGTLKSREHDDRRWVLRELDATRLATQNRHELVVDDLHDLLRRVQRARNLMAKSTFANSSRELLNNLERNVSIE